MPNQNEEYRGTVAPSKHDLEHLTEILTQNYGDWFSAQLLRLIRKADLGNREKLRRVYPYHVQAVTDWFNGEDIPEVRATPID